MIACEAGVGDVKGAVVGSVTEDDPGVERSNIVGEGRVVDSYGDLCRRGDTEDSTGTPVGVEGISAQSCRSRIADTKGDARALGEAEIVLKPVVLDQDGSAKSNHILERNHGVSEKSIQPVCEEDRIARIEGKETELFSRSVQINKSNEGKIRDYRKVMEVIEEEEAKTNMPIEPEE